MRTGLRLAAELALGVTAWCLLGTVPWGHTAVILTGAVCLALSGLHDPYNGPGCPATCCGCGTAHARLAVWGPDSTADRAEGYCRSCYRAVGSDGSDGFHAGCTVAAVPADLTWQQWDEQVPLLYPTRRPVAWWLTRPGS